MKKKNNPLRYGVLLLSTMIIGSTSISASSAPMATPDEKVATMSKDSHLQSLVNRSELIFHGELIEVREKLSIENIPYTFVTYRIKQVVSGLYPASTVTLKFVGGHFPNGNRLTASNSPKVKVGEEAILLVQQSVDTGCDFVDCENGRFLVENGEVVAANESALVADGKGNIEYVDFARRIGKKPQVDKHDDVAGFIAHLKQLQPTQMAEQRLSRKAFVDADINAPFKAYPVLLSAGRAPKVPHSIKSQTPRDLKGSDFDRWEVEQLRLNGGNPLLDSTPADDKQDL